MMVKHKLFLLFFIFLSLPKLQAHDAATLSALTNRLTVLENLVASQYTTPGFFRIRSLSDFGGWTWNNKGKIMLIVVSACIVKRLFNSATKKDLEQYDLRNAKRYTDITNRQQVILDGINILLSQENQKHFEDVPIPTADNNIFDRAINWIGDSAIHAITLPISWAWNRLTRRSS